MKAVWNFIKKIPLILYLIILLIVVFSFFSKNYLTTRNFIVLLQQSSVLLLVASCATFIIITGGLDLSLGGILTVSGVVAAMCVTSGMPLIVTFLAAAAVGALCGAFNGFFISVCGLPPFITTLGSQGVFYAAALLLTHNIGIVIYDEKFISLAAIKNKTFPMAFIWCVLIWFVIILIQDRTRFGRYLFAIGGNTEGARLSGINTKFWKFFVYMFAGFMVGIASVILVSRLEVADPIVGQKWEFEAIACSILGGTSMNIGKGDVKGTILGVFLLTVVRSGMNVIRVPSLWQPAILGLILIGAIVIQVRLSMKEARK